MPKGRRDNRHRKDRSEEPEAKKPHDKKEQARRRKKLRGWSKSPSPSGIPDPEQEDEQMQEHRTAEERRGTQRKRREREAEQQVALSSDSSEDDIDKEEVRGDSRREDLTRHLRAQRKELRSLRNASHTQQNQTVAISTMLQSKLVADRSRRRLRHSTHTSFTAYLEKLDGEQAEDRDRIMCTGDDPEAGD